MKRLKTAWAFALVWLLMFSTASFSVTRQDVLDQGLRSNHPYSYALAAEAAEAGPKEEKKELLGEALAVSPDLPGLYFKLAWLEMPDLFGGLDLVIDGMKAYGGNFWWWAGLAGLLYACLMVSLALALAVVAALRLSMDLPLLAHDMAENKAKLLLLVPVLALAALGLPAFLVGVVFLAGFYMTKKNKPVFYLATALLLFFPLLLGLANTFFSLPSPGLRAAVAVNENRDNGFPIEALKDGSGFVSRFSYATALKRAGLAREAIEVFSGMIEEDPRPRVYNNMGNAYAALGRYDYAKDAYQRALKLGRSAVTLYNLSQLYRDEFDYPTGDKYYDDAMAVDRDLVAGFTGVAGKGPNRLVADETLSAGELWRYARRNRMDMLGVFPASPLAASAAGAALLLLFVLTDGKMTNRAYRCARCGKISCGKCHGSGRVRGSMCPDCYRAQMSPDEESPKARVARMLKVSQQRNRLMSTVRALSFVPPGISQIYSGRVLTGLLYMWMFLFAAIAIGLNPFFTTGMAFFSHGWLTPVLALWLVSLYAASFISINRRVDRGWL